MTSTIACVSGPCLPVDDNLSLLRGQIWEHRHLVQSRSRGQLRGDGHRLFHLCAFWKPTARLPYAAWQSNKGDGSSPWAPCHPSPEPPPWGVPLKTAAFKKATAHKSVSKDLHCDQSPVYQRADFSSPQNQLRSGCKQTKGCILRNIGEMQIWIVRQIH